MADRAARAGAGVCGARARGRRAAGGGDACRREATRATSIYWMTGCSTAGSLVTLEIVLLHRSDFQTTLLPAGRLREPLAALERADFVVLREDDIGFDRAGAPLDARGRAHTGL